MNKFEQVSSYCHQISPAGGEGAGTRGVPCLKGGGQGLVAGGSWRGRGQGRGQGRGL